MADTAKLVLPHLLFSVECLHGCFNPWLAMKCLRRIFPSIIIKVVLFSVALLTLSCTAVQLLGM